MNTERIAKNLHDISGFKPLFKGLFGGGKAKKSYEVYAGATVKGVYPLALLRQDKHEGTNYAVCAFCPAGEISADALTHLRQRAGALDLGTIRYESLSYSRLEPWRGLADSLAAEQGVVAALSSELPGTFIFPVADQADCAYVIYAQQGDTHYIYPITEKQASDIAG